MGRWEEVARGWLTGASRRYWAVAAAAVAMAVLLGGIPGSRPPAEQAAGERFGPVHWYQAEGSPP